MKKAKRKAKSKNELQGRWLKREIEEGLQEAYLGQCPACRGNVFGALDQPKCEDCGWSNNQNNFFERGAA